MNTFQVQQEGTDIRVVDADGSTYTGKIEQWAKNAELEAARRKASLFERVFDREPVLRAVPAGRDETVLQRDLEMISAEALFS